jgi:hypothetical protein
LGAPRNDENARFQQPAKSLFSPAQKPAASLSRRALCPAVFLSTAAVGVALTFGIGVAEAQTKVDKQTAKYQDHPKDGQQCAACRFFRPPKSCQLVDGDISPNGWCSFFAKKP